MSNVSNKKKRINQGFTLIELLVVLVILGLLAGLVGPKLIKHVGDSKTKTAKLQISELGSALEMFSLDMGRYPSNEEGLSALVTDTGQSPGWNGPYLRKKTLPMDPWKEEYSYQYPGKNGDFDIYSLGADKMPGGVGENSDIQSWSI